MEQKTPLLKPVILVVEDDALIRMNAIDILEEDGFSIQEASCAETAMQILEDNSDIQLIFTDIQMPGRYDGLDLARLVHARWPEIGLVVTSGRILPNRSDIPGNGRFIPKPYAPSQLINQVKDLLQLS
jgi:CheY-like chemotaxis protein